MAICGVFMCGLRGFFMLIYFGGCKRVCEEVETNSRFFVILEFFNLRCDSFEINVE